jgi:putative addiction module component (TIGR02574 family)
MGEIKKSDIIALSVEERLDLIERIWDTLSATPEKVPVPAWHVDAIDQAIEAHSRDPEAGATWDEVKRRIPGGS